MGSCLAAQIRFLMFKGPGSFQKNLKIGGNVEFSKAYHRFKPSTIVQLFMTTVSEQ